MSELKLRPPVLIYDNLVLLTSAIEAESKATSRSLTPRRFFSWARGFGMTAKKGAAVLRPYKGGRGCHFASKGELEAELGGEGDAYGGAGAEEVAEGACWEEELGAAGYGAILRAGWRI